MVAKKTSLRTFGVTRTCVNTIYLRSITLSTFWVGLAVAYSGSQIQSVFLYKRIEPYLRPFLRHSKSSNIHSFSHISAFSISLNQLLKMNITAILTHGQFGSTLLLQLVISEISIVELIELDDLMAIKKPKTFKHIFRQHMAEFHEYS